MREILKCAGVRYIWYPPRIRNFCGQMLRVPPREAESKFFTTETKTATFQRMPTPKEKQTRGGRGSNNKGIQVLLWFAISIA